MIADALADSLLTVLTRADFREQLGRQARQHVVEHFSLSYVADRYMALYQDLLANGTNGRSSYFREWRLDDDAII